MSSHTSQDRITEHRKKVRLIRPRQSEAEQGDQRNYGELPYLEVQSLPSPLPSAQAIAADKGRNCGKAPVSMLRWKESNLHLHPEQVTLFP
jgi:hypothetical protein